MMGALVLGVSGGGIIVVVVNKNSLCMWCCTCGQVMGNWFVDFSQLPEVVAIKTVSADGWDNALCIEHGSGSGGTGIGLLSISKSTIVNGEWVMFSTINFVG